jgi:ABC-2 type transport system ATP-binding protein
MANPSVELIDIKKKFGDHEAVKGISLSVPPGVIFGLLGPNGAGKSTTIRMIMDIIAPDSGEVRLFGRKRTPADSHRLGYLPEERGLYRKMQVTDQLLFLAEIHGLKRREALPRIERWLERVDLVKWGRSKVEELSKGMQQKIQLIGTLLHEPEILVLDEPFSGLDPINQTLFKELLQDYKAQGKTVLFSTHGMEQAEKMCDHIGLISQGRLVLVGELAAIKREKGGNSFRLETPNDLARLSEVAGIEQVVPRPGGAKILLAADAHGPEVVRQLVQLIDVTGFRSEEPDLEEIFVKAVRDAA